MLKKTILRLHSIYALILFAITFLVVYPLFLLAIWVPKWWRLMYYANQIWAKIFFPLAFIRVRISGAEHLKAISGNCIICANHFSYLDIPLMVLVPRPFIFVGKASVSKIPLFGYMFRKLHIPVNRSSSRSKYQTYVKSKVAMESGKDLMFFPEGGIFTKNPPQMVAFKEGAFKLAAELQKPIVPVTLPDNWRIFPDDGMLMPRPGTCRIIIHPPIDPAISEQNEVRRMQDQCFATLQAELDRASMKSI
jgi:1-acyl-sn-glycerol-3-phosphate acyltransferase